MIRFLFPLCALVAAGCSQPRPDSGIAIGDAWARATAPGQTSAAIYATITNSGGADRLVAVSSPAGMAMLHGNDSKGGVARMRMLEQVPIPAGATVALAPGRTHIMLTGLKAPLDVGARLSLTMRFATSGPRTVAVAIVAPGSR